MKIVEKIFDIQTGEETIVERDETVEEQKRREKFEKEAAELAEKAKERTALLEKLGISEDEARLLLS